MKNILFIFSFFLFFQIKSIDSLVETDNLDIENITLDNEFKVHIKKDKYNCDIKIYHFNYQEIASSQLSFYPNYKLSIFDSDKSDLKLACLRSISINDDYRKRGLGSRLFKLVVELCEKLKIDLLYWKVQPFNEQFNGIRGSETLINKFYRKNGAKILYRDDSNAYMMYIINKQKFSNHIRSKL